ncbi:hypothetical protein C8J56DRAFT_899966 [Mycena floridula]|nr:hypothetical protein C8J56DRAFT_899935 [Mycena floridula]KAJ7576449.1 hypothetical protein C8J56DRAFT_899966 [Mycena floridula]
MVQAKAREYYHTKGKALREKARLLARQQAQDSKGSGIFPAEEANDYSGPSRISQIDVLSGESNLKLGEQYQARLKILEKQVDAWESKWGGPPRWRDLQVSYDCNEYDEVGNREFEEHIERGRELEKEFCALFDGEQIPTSSKIMGKLNRVQIGLVGRVATGINALRGFCDGFATGFATALRWLGIGFAMALRQPSTKNAVYRLILMVSRPFIKDNDIGLAD